MLFAATRAPSGSNRQAFRFMVLSDGPKAAAAKALVAEGARKVWVAKREHDGYDRGSGAEQLSPKARMARTMQSYVDHFAEVPVSGVSVPCCVIGSPHRWKGHRSTRPVRTFSWPPEPSVMEVHFTGMHYRWSPSSAPF